VDSENLPTLQEEALTFSIRQTAFEAHCYFGSGYLEKVYENSLAHRLRKKGHEVLQQHPLMVSDEDGTVVGEYCADLLVDGRVIVEIKAVRSLANEHIAQVLNYLKTTGLHVGLLINFGAKRICCRRFVL
jgi:GxxExxY protein